jgi:glutamine synthetase
MVDLKFCDLLGTLAAHDAAAARVRRVRVRRGARLRRLVDPRLAGDLGVGHAADADPTSAILDPAHEAPTAVASSCERLRDPVTRELYAKDPRRIARRAEEYLPLDGASPTPLYFGHDVRVLRHRRRSATSWGRTRPRYLVDSAEGHWNSGQTGGSGYTAAPQGGLLPGRRRPTRSTDLPHADGADARADSASPCEFHHHEVASGGPVRDRPPLREPDEDGRPGHDLQVRRQNVARGHGKSVTFMPKPIFGDNGSGCTAISPSGRRGRR